MNIGVFIKRKNTIYIFSDTLLAIITPIMDIFSPITNFILGPSPPSSPSKMSTVPLFGPINTCFMSSNSAPFTVVLNQKDTSRTFYTGK